MFRIVKKQSKTVIQISIKNRMDEYIVVCQAEIQHNAGETGVNYMNRPCYEHDVGWKKPVEKCMQNEAEFM